MSICAKVKCLVLVLLYIYLTFPDIFCILCILSDSVFVKIEVPDDDRFHHIYQYYSVYFSIILLIIKIKEFYVK